MTDSPTGVWDTPKKILVILAHPDDPEFFCGGTLAKWARAGHELTVVLLTCGDKGFNDETTPDKMTPDQLCAIRHDEQRAASAIIGVHAVHFLDLEDGYLIPDLALRRQMVRVIREHKPDILVTCDPQNLFAGYGLNHPDHRACGQIVLDAAFPAAGSPVFFPELLADGFAPHMPDEIWCSLTSAPNTIMDVTETWEVKMTALTHHKTQIGDPAELFKRMRTRHTEDSTDENPRYEEKFRVVKYS